MESGTHLLLVQVILIFQARVECSPSVDAVLCKCVCTEGKILRTTHAYEKSHAASHSQKTQTHIQTKRSFGKSPHRPAPVAWCGVGGGRGRVWVGGAGAVTQTLSIKSSLTSRSPACSCAVCAFMTASSQASTLSASLPLSHHTGESNNRTAHTRTHTVGGYPRRREVCEPYKTRATLQKAPTATQMHLLHEQ